MRFVEKHMPSVPTDLQYTSVLTHNVSPCPSGLNWKNVVFTQYPTPHNTTRISLD